MIRLIPWRARQGRCGCDSTERSTLTLRKPSLLVLCEEKSEEIDPAGSAWINGQKVRPILSGPHVGFNADGHRVPEHWQFLRYPLAHGRNRAVVELLTRSEEPRVSVWAWAFKPGEVRGSKQRNSLPQPDRISLDSARLMAETGIKAISLRTVRMRSPIEKIDGIYLDCRSPASTTGEIHKNTSAGSGPCWLPASDSSAASAWWPRSRRSTTSRANSSDSGPWSASTRWTCTAARISSLKSGATVGSFGNPACCAAATARASWTSISPDADPDPDGPQRRPTADDERNEVGRLGRGPACCDPSLRRRTNPRARPVLALSDRPASMISPPLRMRACP